MVSFAPSLHSNAQSALASFMHILSGCSLAVCAHLLLRKYRSITVFRIVF